MLVFNSGHVLAVAGNSSIELVLKCKDPDEINSEFAFFAVHGNLTSLVD